MNGYETSDPSGKPVPALPMARVSSIPLCPPILKPHPCLRHGATNWLGPKKGATHERIWAMFDPSLGRTRAIFGALEGERT